LALERIADSLFEVQGEVRFLGQRVPARSVVARLADGSLWVYSPVAPDEAVLRELAALGPVRHLIAPSRYHHLFMLPWQERFPQARCYAAPGLAAKRPDLRVDETLTDVAPGAWSTTFEQLVFRGLPVFNEVEFLHRPSRTLIVCDLVFQVQGARGLARLTFRLNDMVGFGPSRMLRLMLRRNRTAAREGLDRILSWDFDRVVMAHGRILAQGGKRALRDAFAFL
jgi:hypothetical protein